MENLTFQQSLIQSSASHDPSEIFLNDDLLLNKYLWAQFIKQMSKINK